MRTLLFVSLLLGNLSAQAQAGKPLNDTPEGCTQLAKTWFAAEYGQGAKKPAPARQSKSTYRAQYNTTLKSCLIRLESNIAASGKSPAIFNVTLYEGDPKSKKSRGEVFRIGDKVTHCLVDGKKCASIEEWESLVKPLLKE